MNCERHCVHPFASHSDHATYYFCCRDGCKEVLLALPPVVVEEKTHGFSYFPHIRVVHVVNGNAIREIMRPELDPYRVALEDAARIVENESSAHGSKELAETIRAYARGDLERKDVGL